MSTIFGSISKVTDKEIAVQRALGTLPMHIKIAYGYAEYTETPSAYGINIMVLSYTYNPNLGYAYNPNKIGDRDKAVKYFIKDCILNNDK